MILRLPTWSFLQVHKFYSNLWTAHKRTAFVFLITTIFYALFYALHCTGNPSGIFCGLGYTYFSPLLVNSPAHVEIRSSSDDDVVLADFPIIKCPGSFNSNLYGNNKEQGGTRKFLYVEPSVACNRSELIKFLSTKFTRLSATLNPESSTSLSILLKFILLTDSSSCPIRTKRLNAQRVGFGAIFICTNEKGMETLEGSVWFSHECKASSINTAFISNYNGLLIETNFTHPKRVNLEFFPKRSSIFSFSPHIFMHYVPNDFDFGTCMTKTTNFIAYVILGAFALCPCIVILMCVWDLCFKKDDPYQDFNWNHWNQNFSTNENSSRNQNSNRNPNSNSNPNSNQNQNSSRNQNPTQNSNPNQNSNRNQNSNPNPNPNRNQNSNPNPNPNRNQNSNPNPNPNQNQNQNSNSNQNPNQNSNQNQNSSQSQQENNSSRNRQSTNENPNSNNGDSNSSRDEENERQRQQQQEWFRRHQQEQEAKNRRENQNLFSKEEQCRILLSVDKNASRRDIIKAFNREVLPAHPDKNRDKPQKVQKQLEEKTKELYEARRYLLSLLPANSN